MTLFLGKHVDDRTMGPVVTRIGKGALIANYNATPHNGIGKRAPLAYAKFLFEHSQEQLRYTDSGLVESLLSVRKLCHVRGGATVGRAVYVEFYYARYTNELLQNRQDLVDCFIWVIHHKEDDGRIALASTQDGMPLGVLRAAPPWHISPHSLPLRRAIHQAQSRGKFQIPANGDAIETFIAFVEGQPHNKLPIHPAYLEARRILSQAADQFVGESLLKAAQNRAMTDVTREEVLAPVAQSPAAGPTSTSGRTRPTVKDNKSSPTHPLPPRRIAATKT